MAEEITKSGGQDLTEQEIDSLYGEGFNVEDGNDPLAKFLDVDLDNMTPEQLKQLHAELSEISSNPKAVKRVLEKGKGGLSKEKKAEANSVFAQLGLDIVI